MTSESKELTRRPELGDFSDLWDHLSRFERRFPFSRLMRQETPVPAVDMFEKNGSIVVKAEMPGIDADKVEVNVVGNELRISGERQEDKEVRDENYYRSERTYGRIFRTLTLPEGCDTEHVDAQLKDGVLQVEIPKKPAASTRKIEVKAS
jgi:HSP20 family protein